MDTSNKSKLMRKNKRRHNENARQVAEIVIDTREQAKIKVDISDNVGSYDDCNTLVLPSKKRKTKRVQIVKQKPLLSKKKKKLLEKILEKKAKNANRLLLLEKLEKVQAQPEQIQLLTSLQEIQTMGRKKFFQQMEKEYQAEDITENLQNTKININAPNPLKRWCTGPGRNNNKCPTKRIRLDNVVETSSSEDEDDENEVAPEILLPNKNNLNISLMKLTSNSHDVKETPKIFPVTDIVDITGPEKIAGNKIVRNGLITPAIYKIVNRSPEITEYRLKLPVVLMEYEIMTAINENNVVIIDGSTGSGKTTQVPQFLYEAGFTKNDTCIAVTEPRRVAAIEMSKRVAYEMNLSQDEISYQIRFEGNTTDNTKIKFLTDGVLLKEFLSDPLLEKYSAIIIDEAHERSVFSDIMIGILSRVVPAREKRGNKLKVIIMSATMDKNSFIDNRKLFATPPPIVKVESRVFEVAIHYNKVTPVDYLDAAYQKACKVHRQLPLGGILIFVTGKEEVIKLCNRLKQTFPKQKKKNSKSLCSNEKRTKGNNTNADTTNENFSQQIPELKLSDFTEKNIDQFKNNEKIISTSGELEEDEEDIRSKFTKNNICEPEQALHVLPMFSMLTSEKFKMVFEDPPPGTRLCVIATNIAETSLTIPNIVYVIDTGKIKGKIYNPITGISKMQVMWTSKASADQRKGRAGRVQSGHCYRLYSATVFTDLFAKHAPADILRRPVDDIVLAMTSKKIPVMTFPYITPPPQEELEFSIKRLKMLGALCYPLSKITPFGKTMCQLPVSPRFSKMIIESFVYPELTPYFILLVCSLTVQEVVIEKRKYHNCRQSWLGNGMSRYLGDIMIIMSGVLKADVASNAKIFCKDNGIRFKAYQEVRKLRRQLTNEANLMFPELNLPIAPESDQLTNSQANVMRKIILQGSLDRIARKFSYEDIKDNSKRKLYHNAYKIENSEEPIYLHFSSPFQLECPHWVVFQEIYEVNGKKTMRAVSTIEYKWIAQIAPEGNIFPEPFLTPR